MCVSVNEKDKLPCFVLCHAPAFGQNLKISATFFFFFFFEMCF